MQYQQEIPTISRVAPPSYAEAMAQAARMKNNGPNPPHAPRLEDLQYEQTAEVPPYSAAIISGSGPGSSSNYQSRVRQPICDPSGPPSMQQARIPPPCVMRVERVVYKTRWKDRCCTPKVTAGIVTFLLIILLIKVFVDHTNKWGRMSPRTSEFSYTILWNPSEVKSARSDHEDLPVSVPRFARRRALD